MLQLEIYEAYKVSKSVKTIMITPLNHFKYIDEQIPREMIKKYLQNIVTLHVDKRHRGKYKKQAKNQSLFEWDQEQQDIPIQIRSEQAPYLLARCLQKIQNSDRAISQAIFEYEWFSEDRNSKVNQILKHLCRVLVKKFKDEEIAYKAKEIEAIGQVKKKKKRNRKNKQDEEEKTESNKSEELSDHEGQGEKQPFAKKREEKKQQIRSNPPQKQEKEVQSQSKVKKGKNGKKAKQSQRQEQALLNSPRKDLQAKKQGALLNQRINEYILSFQQQLLLSSQAIDKGRKNCLETIQHTIKGMNIKSKWQLVLFGSYSIDFALRDSDLDLALILENAEGCSIDWLFQHFKAQEWLRNCNIVQIQSAKVFILQFQVILDKLKPTKSKTKEQVIHVDISITVKSELHEGVRNTAIMKELFESSPDLKVVSLVFKELLRIYQLNKPFKGGIGSYVLVILVHNILQQHQDIKQGNYLDQLLAVCTFMTEHFEPYSTLISPHQKSTLAINPKLQLNIEDPRDRYLLNTSKIRQINEILGVFQQYLNLLQEVKVALAGVSLQQRKKMKRIFFEHWNVLFKPQEETAH